MDASPPRKEQAISGATPSITPGHSQGKASGSSRSLRCFLEPENMVHCGGRQGQRLENSALAVKGPLGCVVRFYYSLEAAGSLGGGASKVGGELLGQERFRFPEGSTKRS